MNIYDIFMTPIERFFLQNIRAELVSQAKNNVLEIGAGTGVNFKYYDYNKVTALTCLDMDYPSNIANKYPDVNFVTGNVENMPFEADSFDCIVSTLVLCSVDIEKSLLEIQNMLKPNGIFIFIEHIKPTGETTAKIADTLNHLWPKIANGCNLNRQTDKIIANSGFNKVTMNYKGIFCYGIAEN